MSADNRPMTYEEAASYLGSLKHKKWRGGMDRMEEFIRQSGLSEAVQGDKPKYIHVTGTNGKGSTTACVQSILSQAGYRTGGYFSPYVYDLRERIQIDRELISKDDFARIASILAPIAEAFEDTEFGGVSEFEFKTAMGFMAWRDAGCDWVALEVGIGGLLDSTNVVTPACSVIVSIGLDHLDLLGSTHAEIAIHKAGIIKPGKPCVIGKLPAEAEAVVSSVCRENGSELWRLGREVTVVQDGGLWTVAVPGRIVRGLVPGLKGDYQVGNMAIAVAAVIASGAEVSDEALQTGVRETRLPGRFEIREINGRTCILDGAHNGESAQILANAVKNRFPGKSVTLLTAMLAGHDPVRFYKAFAGLARQTIATEVAFYRRVPAVDLARRIPLPNVEAIPETALAFQKALDQTPAGDILLVTGSFYLLGDLQEALRELASSQNEA